MNDFHLAAFTKQVHAAYEAGIRIFTQVTFIKDKGESGQPSELATALSSNPDYKDFKTEEFSWAAEFDSSGQFNPEFFAIQLVRQLEAELEAARAGLGTALTPSVAVLHRPVKMNALGLIRQYSSEGVLSFMLGQLWFDGGHHYMDFHVQFSLRLLSV